MFSSSVLLLQVHARSLLPFDRKETEEKRRESIRVSTFAGCHPCRGVSNVVVIDVKKGVPPGNFGVRRHRFHRQQRYRPRIRF